MNIANFKNEELAVFRLRELYCKYGFLQYKMSKFEEYDLYVRNKDFLVSENIITFTDTDGKLMALKPDVTLSIIKNSKPAAGFVEKVYYNENVYRVSKGTHSYKEIMQAGIECIGDIDDYNIYEVIMLAAKSLEIISDDFVLDLSHLGIVSEIIDSLGVSEKVRRAILSAIGEKNMHTLSAICAEEGIDGSQLKILIKAYGAPDMVIPELEKIECLKESPSLSQLKKINNILKQNSFYDRIRLDFSVINDMNYYNGFVFKGFINGISSGILSGGQYDSLMQKMKKNCGAIGFAVYLDMLELLDREEIKYDVDTVILYDENCDMKALSDAVSMLTSNGNSVTALKSIPEKIKYRQLLKLNEKGVEIIENNA